MNDSVHPKVVLAVIRTPLLPRCACKLYCSLGGPCEYLASAEDLICDFCRKYSGLHCHVTGAPSFYCEFGTQTTGDTDE